MGARVHLNVFVFCCAAPVPPANTNPSPTHAAPLLSLSCPHSPLSTLNAPANDPNRRCLRPGAGLKKTIAQDGVLSLYKGFIPGWLRMAPWSLCFFLSFKQLRKALGLSSLCRLTPLKIRPNYKKRNRRTFFGEAFPKARLPQPPERGLLRMSEPEPNGRANRLHIRR